MTLVVFQTIFNKEAKSEPKLKEKHFNPDLEPKIYILSEYFSY